MYRLNAIFVGLLIHVVDYARIALTYGSVPPIGMVAMTELTMHKTKCLTSETTASM